MYNYSKNPLVELLNNNSPNFNTADAKLRTTFNLLLNHGYNPNDIQNFVNADFSPYKSVFAEHPMIQYARDNQALLDTFKYSPIYNRNLVEDLQNVQDYAIKEEAASWDREPWNKPSSVHNLITKYGYDPYLLHKSMSPSASNHNMEYAQAIISEATGGHLGKPASVPEGYYYHEPAMQSAETLMNLTPEQMFKMDARSHKSYSDAYLLYLLRDLVNKGGNK